MVDLREAPLAEGRLQVPLEITIVPSERRWTEINDTGTPLLRPRIKRDLAEYRVDVSARGLRMFGARQEQLSVANVGRSSDCVASPQGLGTELAKPRSCLA